MVKWTHAQPPYLINAVNQKWPEESCSFPRARLGNANNITST